MQVSVKNWKKPTPRKIKMIGDMCVYTLPMWQGLITTSPFSDTWKIWLNFIIGALLIMAKAITKLFSENEQLDRQRDRQRCQGGDGGGSTSGNDSYGD